MAYNLRYKDPMVWNNRYTKPNVRPFIEELLKGKAYYTSKEVHEKRRDIGYEVSNEETKILELKYAAALWVENKIRISKQRMLNVLREVEAPLTKTQLVRYCGLSQIGRTLFYILLSELIEQNIVSVVFFNDTSYYVLTEFNDESALLALKEIKTHNKKPPKYTQEYFRPFTALERAYIKELLKNNPDKNAQEIMDLLLAKYIYMPNTIFIIQRLYDMVKRRKKQNEENKQNNNEEGIRIEN
jgi:hypothetical protein